MATKKTADKKKSSGKKSSTAKKAAKKKKAGAGQGAAALDWDVHHLACLNTYWSLYVQRQMDDTVTFDAAGKLKTGDLFLHNDVLSGDQLRFAAEIAAKRMDDFFRGYVFATFQNAGETFASAKDKMADVLVSKARTMPQLAAVVDAIYLFRGEA